MHNSYESVFQHLSTDLKGKTYELISTTDPTQYFFSISSDIDCLFSDLDIWEDLNNDLDPDDYDTALDNLPTTFPKKIKSQKPIDAYQQLDSKQNENYLEKSSTSFYNKEKEIEIVIYDKIAFIRDLNDYYLLKDWLEFTKPLLKSYPKPIYSRSEAPPVAQQIYLMTNNLCFASEDNNSFIQSLESESLSTGEFQVLNMTPPDLTIDNQKAKQRSGSIELGYEMYNDYAEANSQIVNSNTNINENTTKNDIESSRDLVFKKYDNMNIIADEYYMDNRFKKKGDQGRNCNFDGNKIQKDAHPSECSPIDKTSFRKSVGQNNELGFSDIVTGDNSGKYGRVHDRDTRIAGLENEVKLWKDKCQVLEKKLKALQQEISGQTLDGNLVDDSTELTLKKYFPILKKKFDQLIGNIDVATSQDQRYKHQTDIIIKHEQNFLESLKKLSAKTDFGQVTNQVLNQLETKELKKLTTIEEAIQLYKNQDYTLQCEGHTYVTDKAISTKNFMENLILGQSDALSHSSTTNPPVNCKYSIKYNGYLQDDKKEGFGLLKSSTNNTPVVLGFWKEDRLYGKINYLFHKNGNIMYKGAFVDNIKVGFGKEFYNNGFLYYKGQYAKNLPDGNDIKLYYSNGNLKYSGDCAQGVYQGFGSFYWPNGILRYQGNWSDGKITGNNVKIYYNNGNVEYEGQMRDGQFEGVGRYFYENGRKKFEGTLRKGKPIVDDMFEMYDLSGSVIAFDDRRFNRDEIISSI